MPGLSGELIDNPRDLTREHQARRRPYYEKSVRVTDAPAYEQDGWQIHRTAVRVARLRKPKSHDVLFEDRLWQLFHQLGAKQMNADRNCRLVMDGPYTKQVDVVACMENCVFLVECKSSQDADPEPINVRTTLEWAVGHRSQIERCVKEAFGRDIGHICYVVALSSSEKREIDQRYVAAQRGKHVLLWSAQDISYVEQLVRQVSSAARYQLFSVIFGSMRRREERLKCPAVRGKVGGNYIYSFMLPAGELARFAYVHHRKLSGVADAARVYQRMLRSEKIRSIANFLCEGGYFPNSVVVSFSKPVRWDQKESIDHSALGTLTLPEYYGSAWIIDGQHRLYGAVQSRPDMLLPVLAFQNLGTREQANLFVEINRQQTPVPPDLLWDLYTEIYAGTPDRRQQKLLDISNTAKILAESGPLAGIVDIPSNPARGNVKLKMTTVCTTLQSYSPWDLLRHPTNPDQNSENAARIIDCYYSALRELWPEEWGNESLGVVLSNNGFGVFIMVLSDILRHLVYKERRALLQQRQSQALTAAFRDQYLRPAVELLKQDVTSNRQRNLALEIRRKTGRGPQSTNAAMLDLAIRESIADFSPPRIETNPAPPEVPPEPTSIHDKALRAEGTLRSYVMGALKEQYGDESWWPNGVNAHLREEAQRAWTSEIRRQPYLASEEPSPERLFEFLGLGQVSEVVCKHANWEDVFKAVFIDKANFQRRVADVAALRNPVAHERTYNDVVFLDGTSSLVWLALTLGDPDLRP